MFHLLGHIPHEGETVDVAGLRLRADRVQGRRISRVRITRIAVAEDEAPVGDDAAEARRKREHA